MDMMEQHMNMQIFVNVYQGAVSSDDCKEIIDFIKTLFGIREKKLTLEIVNDLSAMDRETS